MYLRSRLATSVVLAISGLSVVAAGMLITASPAAAVSTSGCDPLIRKTKSISGAYVQVDVKNNCDKIIDDGGKPHYGMDYVYFKVKDTKCDGMGPHLFLGYNGSAYAQHYNNKGCGKWTSGWVGWTTSYAKGFRLRNEKTGQVGSDSGWINVG